MGKVQVGVKADWTNLGRERSVDTNWVTSCVRIGKSLWLKVGRSHMFLFLSLSYMVPWDHCWRHNTVQGKPLH